MAGGNLPMVNPCIFKNECKTCRFTDVADRPQMCVSIRCEDYTPCEKCGDNKRLGPNKLCTTCSKKPKDILVRGPQGQFMEVEASHAPHVTNALTLPAATDVPTRQIPITVPGHAPAVFTEDEIAYYNSQWQEYSSYYRDPTTRVLLHNLIILEVELNWITSYLTQKRETGISKDIEIQRDRIIRNMGELRNQLPEKEATQESDDERFFSMIYERYVAEIKERRVGNVSRILTPEAIALAPALDFPIDPQKILMNLGYRQVDAIEAVQHIVVDQLPDDPKQVLAWMGFPLDEKYALPLGDIIEAETLPDDVDDPAKLDLPDIEPVQPLASRTTVEAFNEYSGPENEYA